MYAPSGGWATSPGRLALVHFDAAKYTTLDLRKKAEKEAQKIFPNTFACEDDLVVEMG